MTKDAEKHPTVSGRIESLTSQGVAYFKKAAFDMALACFAEATLLCQGMDNIDEEARQRTLAAEVYCASDRPEQALDSYRKALKLAARLGDDSRTAALNNNIGLLLTRLQRYQEALDVFQAALRLFEAASAAERAADQLGNMGSVCRDNEEYDRALDFYHQALRRFEHLHLPARIADQYANIGYIHVLQENKAAALEHFSEAEALYRNCGEDLKARLAAQNIQLLRG